MSPKVIDVGRFGDIFWHQFSLDFTTPRKLIFATRIIRKPIFYHFRPSILASKTNKQLMCFPIRFLDLIFPICFQFVSKYLIWGPLQNPVGAKMGPTIDQVAPNCKTVPLLFPTVEGFIRDLLS